MSYNPIKDGSVTLVGGTKTVADLNILSTSKIIFSNDGSGGTPGLLSLSITPASSFTITSANALDTSLINYLLIY